MIARAPSNIALIKYMGKADPGENLPANPSLSLTLHDLCSYAEAVRGRSGRGAIQWVPEAPRVEGEHRELLVPMLGDSGTGRVIRHAERALRALPELLAKHGLEAQTGLLDSGSLLLRSANTFPPSSGIASSASSFAALTLAVARAGAASDEAFGRAWHSREAGPSLRRSLAELSRRGSGSSCRSFEGPWVLWEGARAAAVSTRMPEMAHFLILVSSEPKQVSSSEAHARVRTSPLWDGRIERSTARLRSMLSAMAEGNIAAVSRAAWNEAWEMHSLFHTSAEPFTYWQSGTPGTVGALRWLAPLIAEPTPPIVTLDAGPNVHVLVEASQAASWRRRLEDRFGEKVILTDRQGGGPELC